MTKLQASPAAPDESDKEAQARKTRIEQLLLSIDQDADGIIDADLVLEASFVVNPVIALMERHGDVKMSTAQIASMVEMLKKEGEVEAMTKKIDALDAPIMPQGPTSGELTEDGGDKIESSKKSKERLLDIPEVDPKVTVPLSNKNGGNGVARPHPEKPPS
ncbi:unnamed protein product [Heligmosomoides polygyrus]|uniref:Uncharacterized protein n=1 Tax=Heligmosomoides polygyrus TaxID=6339 RepID=A0A3P8IYK2_HELPZ|nr:unnamed protein product [Heligmosomoides polygyrus]